MYTSAKKMVMTIVMTISFVGSTIAQEQSGISREVGNVGYIGDYSPAEIMEAEASRILGIDQDARINFEVSIPVMENGRALVGDITGLPLHKPDHDSVISSATMVIPFQINEFKQGTSFDSLAFSERVSKTLSRIPKNAKPQKNKSGPTLQSHALNSPNCGGYPLGTTVTVTTESCIFGNYTTRYSCNINPTTGGNDWYIVDSSWIAPNCIVP